MKRIGTLGPRQSVTVSVALPGSYMREGWYYAEKLFADYNWSRNRKRRAQAGRELARLLGRWPTRAVKEHREPDHEGAP